MLLTNSTQTTNLRRLETNFMFIILALNIIGLINLYSATHGVLNTHAYLFWQQLVWLGGGWVVFFAITFIDYDFIKRIATPFYIINILALLAVLFYGVKVLGAQRWIDLGFFRYQPSETTKIAVVLLLAKYLSARSYPQGMGLKDLIIPLSIAFVPFAITVLQPDLGTSLLILAIAVHMLFFIKIRSYILIFACLIGLIATPLIWNFGLKGYQKNRILTFVSPGSDPRGKGYNSIQSKIAVGSGKILGKGFQKGTQSQLEFIPERHSDFIYSVLSEEHGFLGSILTLGLFITLFSMIVKIASQANDKFGVLLCTGILALLFWHVFVNIGMVIGLLPIVGVPLPLLSYGGSSMITIMAGLGLVSSVARKRHFF